MLSGIILFHENDNHICSYCNTYNITVYLLWIGDGERQSLITSFYKTKYTLKSPTCLYLCGNDYVCVMQ